MSAYDIDGTVLEGAYSKSAVSLSSVYEIDGTEIPFSPTPQREWKSTAVISALPSVSVSGTKQGGCTDGTYIYQCSGDSSGYSYMKVIKYRISDGTYTTVQYDGTPNFGHANDMTYNPNTGYLYVATMLSDGSVIVLDADDLSYVNTIYLTNGSGNAYQVWQFCYDRIHNKYYSSHGNAAILVYDSNWNYERSVTLPTFTSATQQGCETDGTYYYKVTYNPNRICICTLGGEYVTEIINPVSGEPETLMYDWDGNYYFSKNASSSFLYSIELYDEVSS